MYSDLKPALLLGGHNLLNCLNKDRNYLPNWFLNVDETYKAECYFWWPGHNLGRWWDAMLRLEESVDFLIPPEIEAAMLVNMRLFFDNPDSWCIQPDLYGG